MSDEFGMTFPDPPVPKRTSLQKAVTGTRREQLEALRDYISEQLEANMCNACRTSRLRTGDQASLVARLQKILEELEGLPRGDGLDPVERLIADVKNGPHKTSASRDVQTAPIRGRGAPHRARG